MSALFLGLFISLVGMAAFAYGKKTSRVVPLAGGLVLMIYPYFVPNTLAMAVIAGLTLLLVASVAGLKSSQGIGAYGVSKAALICRQLPLGDPSERRRSLR